MINTLTLNPGIGHIFYFDRLEKNITNRIKSSSISIISHFLTPLAHEHPRYPPP